MKTICRINSKYKPSLNFLTNTVNYMSDPNLTNLIKRADEYCVRYCLEYDEPIYKVIETSSFNLMENTGVRLKSNKTRYKGVDELEKVYYEAKLRKVVTS